MIYLTTGANGSGKTLLTLKDVREQQLKENRPVYYHGFDMNPETAAEFGWKEFDPKKWQDLPDGSICIMDECQNEFPLRRGGADVPDYVNAVAQHRRRRGFDFWMICPHPSLLDTFIRRLIDKPSWHRHLKRAFGANVVSVITFGSPDMTCEKPGAGARGTVSMRPFPKEVYAWYNSAQLHTGKRKIPKALYMVVAGVVLVPTLLYFGVKTVYTNATKGVEVVAPGESEAGVPQLQAGGGGYRNAPLTADEYVEARKPRLRDFPHTAPAYDDVVKPAVAPYPAACVHMGKTCKCYSQQATLLQVSGQVCMQIVAQGYFVDWQQPQQREQQTMSHERATTSARDKMPEQVPTSIPVPVAIPRESQPLYAYENQGLAARNAQVRGALR
ncbi:MAG: hypothetical protein BGO13_10930 [Burkholderiales bacterium 66-5]|nr:MAG: hypothetical protein BGO13_10930 [Burkholderiales bacterium 66-5]